MDQISKKGILVSASHTTQGNGIGKEGNFVLAYVDMVGNMKSSPRILLILPKRNIMGKKINVNSRQWFKALIT